MQIFDDEFDLHTMNHVGNTDGLINGLVHVCCVEPRD